MLAASAWSTPSRSLPFGCVLLLACGCGDASDAAYYEPEQTRSGPLVSSSIDSDAQLEGRDPGRGVGLFVEYESGGHWQVDVSCDTELSELGCSWVVVAEPREGSVFGIVTRDLEHSDDFVALSSRVALTSFTNFDLDGFSFRTEPGVPLGLYVSLDGLPDGRFVFWVGDGAVHGGVPEVPFELVPTSP